MSNIQSRVRAAIRRIADNPVDHEGISSYAVDAILGVNTHAEGRKDCHAVISSLIEMQEKNTEITEAFLSDAFNKVSAATVRLVMNARDLEDYVTGGDEILRLYDEEYLPRAQKMLQDDPSPESERRVELLQSARTAFNDRLSSLVQLEDASRVMVRQQDELLGLIQGLRQ